MDKFKKLFFRAFAPFIIFLGSHRANSQTGLHFNAFNGADSVIGTFMRDWHIGGGSVAIVKDGRLIYSKGFGYSDFERTIPTEPNSLFRIASISKPVTSIAIMKLIEEGRLSLSDKVFGEGRLISDPYYLNVINDKRIYDITVRDLLQHTSGWDRNVPYGPFPHCDAPFFPLYVTEASSEPNPVGDSTLIRFKLGSGLNFAPGTQYSYSNVGYLVLGKIISRVTGMAYEEYIKENILEPAGIFDMHLGHNLRSEKLEREVDYISHVIMPSCYGDGSMVMSQYGGFNLEAMNAHGGWVSSAPDLARLFVALKSGALLEQTTLCTMLTPGNVNPNYALGWQVNDKGNYWHTGSLDGTAAFAANTSDGYTWVVLLNSRSDNSAAFWNALDRLPRAAIRAIHGSTPLDLFPPSVNGGYITSHELSRDKISVQWLGGDGESRLVVVSTEPLKSFPLDGMHYQANTDYGLGDRVDERAFVVYNGPGNRAILSRMDPAQTYYLTIFEYRQDDSTGEKEVYKLGGRETVVIGPRTGQEM